MVEIEDSVLSCEVEEASLNSGVLFEKVLDKLVVGGDGTPVGSATPRKVVAEHATRYDGERFV